jgi:hypothetical protein
MKTGLNRGVTKSAHEIVDNLTTRRGQRHTRRGDKLKERARGRFSVLIILNMKIK